MSQKCICCGAALAEGSSFCPHCATQQADKTPVKPPRRWRRKLAAVLAALLVLCMAAGLVHLLTAPKTYRGAGEVVYTDDAGTWHVLLSFSGSNGVSRNPQSLWEVTQAPGQISGFPLQLYVYREDTEELVIEEFMSKVRSCTVQATPRDGAEPVRCGLPAHTENFPFAAYMADVIYSSQSGTNDILWTIEMKNGDALQLSTVLTVTEQDAVTYTPENAAMDTAADLQALLDTIERELPAETVVYLYLPPVVYDAPITLGDHDYFLYGGSNGEVQTTFTDTLYVGPTYGAFSEVHGVLFAGSGGIGVSARSSVVFRGCVFTGWDTAALAQTGAWVAAEDSIFDGNGTGLHFNTAGSVGTAARYYNNRFVDNGTAVYIESLHTQEVLLFTGSSFAGNGADIENPTGYPVDTSGASFEN